MLLLFGKDLVDNLLVILVGVIDAGAVLRSRIVALAVNAGWVDGFEVNLKQELQRHLRRIVGDMDGFSKAGLVGAYLFVSRVFRSAIGKANLDVHHSINLLEKENTFYPTDDRPGKYYY